MLGKGNILLVEDDESDIHLMQLAIQKTGRKVQLDVVRIGDSVMSYLAKAPPFEKAEKPDLILLDLNIPGLNGKDILSQVKADNQWRNIPVIVLSSSSYEGDVKDCYSLHANCYLKKPQTLDSLIDLVASILKFWISEVQ